MATVNTRSKNQIDLGSGVSVPWSNTDMAFNLGSLLGGMWAKNYNERGEKKATQTASELANSMGGDTVSSADYVPQQQQPATTTIGGQTVPSDELYQSFQNAQGTNNGIGYGVIAGGADVNSANNGYVPQKFTEMLQQGVGGQVDLSPFTSSKVSQSGAISSSNLNPERNLAAEKLDYLASKYNKGTDNPDTDNREAKKTTDILTNNLLGIDFSKLPSYSVDDVKLAIKAQLRKDGRNDYQINQALEAVTPLLGAKVKQATDSKVANMRNTLDELIDSGRMDDANVLYQQIAKLDPETGKGLQYKMKRANSQTESEANYQQQFSFLKKYNPNWSDREISNYVMFKSTTDPKTASQMQAALRQQQQQLKQQQLDMQQRVQEARLNGTYGSGRSGSGSNSSKSVIGSNEFKHANEKLNNLKEKIEDGGELTKSEQADFNKYSRFVANAETQTYGDGYTNQQPQYNLTDWNSYTQLLTDLRKAGGNDEQILNSVAKLVQNGDVPKEFYDETKRLYDRDK